MIYHAKNIEPAVQILLLEAEANVQIAELTPANLKAATQIAIRIREKFGSIKEAYKPKATGCGEPKTDLVVVNDNEEHFCISIKKDSKNSKVANFTTIGGWVHLMDLLVSCSVPGAVRARDRANELFATKIGVQVMTDKRHLPVFMKEVRKHVPSGQWGIYEQAFRHRHVDQYDEVITKSQLGLQLWLREMYDMEPEFLRTLITEKMSGERFFGVKSEASAKWIANPEGVFSIKEYYPIYMAAKFSKKDIARVVKNARVGYGRYKADDTVENNLEKLATITARVEF